MGEFDTTDPFTQLYDFYMAGLKGHAGIAAIVSVGNYIDLSGSARLPQKKRLQVADVPELYLKPAGGEWPQRTSTSWEGVQNFDLIMTTGDLRVDVILFPLRWQIMRWLASLADQISGKSWVTRAYLEIHEESEDDDERRRKLPGWVNVMTIVNELTIPKSEFS